MNDSVLTLKSNPAKPGEVGESLIAFVDDGLIRTLFAIDLVVLFLLLAAIVWSVVRPDRRIWPPPARRSWQFVMTWICYRAALGLNACLLVLDWNSWVFAGGLRWLLGTPLALLGGMLALWGLATIGRKNSWGTRDGLVDSGPYRFTRNPQTLGFNVLFLGLSIIANSQFLWVTHGLLALVLIVMPLSEEVWLKEQYGQEYERYRRETPRFL